MSDAGLCRKHFRESDFGSVCAQLREYGPDPHPA